MYVISKGVIIDTAKSELDPDYIYITSGIILNHVRNECIVILDSKVPKIKGEMNNIYYEVHDRIFLNLPVRSSVATHLPVSYVDVLSTGFIPSITTPNNEVINFEDQNGTIVASLAQVSREVTESNIIITNKVFTVPHVVLDVVEIYVHNMGVISNPKDIIENITGNTITFKVNDLDNKFIDIVYQYLA
jgi:hypothetical protein